MNLNEQPCLIDCPDRSATCKITCEKWAEHVAKRNKIYEERKKKFELENNLYALKKRRRRSRNGRLQ